MSTIIKEYRSKDTNDRNRTFVEFECDFCHHPHSKQKRFLSIINFCSHKCSGEYKKSIHSKEYSCSFCSKRLLRNPSKQKNSKSGLFFCSKHCRNEAQKIKNGMIEIWPIHYGTSDGGNSYRQWALETYPNKCNNCNYDKYPKLLQVHHIDENRKNNDIKNLELLCPTCHLEKHLETVSGPFSKK